MKIELTKTELLSLLSKQLGFEITEWSIIDDCFANRLDAAVCAAGNPYYAASKIPCIKALRTFVPGLGLADAKWMIENWEQTIQFTKQHGRTPIITNKWDNSATLS